MNFNMTVLQSRKSVAGTGSNCCKAAALCEEPGGVDSLFPWKPREHPSEEGVPE